MTFSVLSSDIFGKSLTLNQSEPGSAAFISGATGTGKSTLIENLTTKDIDRHIGVGVLGSHGDLINRVTGRICKEYCHWLGLLHLQSRTR